MPTFRLRDHPVPVWSAVTVIAGIGIGIAFGVLGLTPAEFDVARFCFWVSAGVIVLAIVISLSGVAWPFWQRALLAGLVGAAVTILLLEALLLVSRREAFAVKAATMVQPSAAPAASAPSKALESKTRHGNLKARTIQLSDDILYEICTRGWRGSPCDQLARRIDQKYILKMPAGDDFKALDGWYAGRSALFLLKFYDDVVNLRNEYAQVHLRDDELEQFIKKCEWLRKTDEHTRNTGAPRPTVVGPHDYVSVAQSLVRLAEQID